MTWNSYVQNVGHSSRHYTLRAKANLENAQLVLTEEHTSTSLPSPKTNQEQSVEASFANCPKTETMWRPIERLDGGGPTAVVGIFV